MSNEINNKWACPTCKRQFARKGQSHSCKVFLLEQHFAGKHGGKILYDKLKHDLEKRVGAFEVDSPECCIHWVKDSTFAAVKVFKDKIRAEFTLGRFVENERFLKWVKISDNRILYYVDLKAESDIDSELIDWLTEAYG